MTLITGYHSADVDLTLRRKWRHLYRDALKKFGPVAWIELESKYKFTYCNINKKPDRKLMFNQKNENNSLPPKQTTTLIKYLQYRIFAAKAIPQDIRWNIPEASTSVIISPLMRCFAF